MPDSVDPEQQRQFDADQNRRNQRIEDARAMIREVWAQYGRSIEAVEVGYKCDIVDELSAQTAIQKIQGAMNNELIRAGLLGDRTMSIEKVTLDSIQSGKSSVQNGACVRLTPASRGRLRSMISDLMR